MKVLSNVVCRRDIGDGCADRAWLRARRRAPSLQI
jgi:hypothetical protein